MDLLGIRPVLRCLCNFLKLSRRRLVGDRQPDASGFQVIAQHVLFFWRRTFVHPKQANVLALRNEISRANIGSQHRFFD